jgi:hypothetical protein
MSLRIMTSDHDVQCGRDMTLALPRQVPVLAGQRPGIDAVAALSCYLFLLIAIPASLVVGAFGAAGPPATLFGAALLFWYLAGKWHPAMALDAGPQPVRTGAIIFGCSVLAAYVSANLSAMSGLETNGADRGLILLSAWLGVVLLAADGIATEDRLAVLLRRVVLGATAMAVLGMAEFATGIDFTKYVTIPGLQVHEQVTDLMLRGGIVRVNATASEPLEFSAVVAMSLPLAFYQARHAAAASRSLRVRRWLQVALIAGAVPMAVSRSAILCLAAIAIILIPTWPRRDRHRAYLALAVSPLLLWLVMPKLLASLLASFSQLATDSSTTSRTQALSSAIPLISAHPWFGQGFQTFFPQTFFFVDDQFITSLIETGVVGLLAVLALFGTGLYVTRNMRRAARDDRTRDLGWCLTASIVVALISFATLDVLSFSIASGLFFLLLGCAGAAWRLNRLPGEPG